MADGSLHLLFRVAGRRAAWVVQGWSWEALVLSKTRKGPCPCSWLGWGWGRRACWSSARSKLGWWWLEARKLGLLDGGDIAKAGPLHCPPLTPTNTPWPTFGSANLLVAEVQEVIISSASQIQAPDQLIHLCVCVFPPVSQWLSTYMHVQYSYASTYRLEPLGDAEKTKIKFLLSKELCHLEGNVLHVSFYSVRATLPDDICT